MAAGTAVYGEMTVSMQIDGIQLFDDSGEKLETRLRRAIDRYKEKFGTNPTHCKVSEGTVSGEVEVLGVKVIGAREFTPGNMLIGVEAGHG